MHCYHMQTLEIFKIPGTLLIFISVASYRFDASNSFFVCLKVALNAIHKKIVFCSNICAMNWTNCTMAKMLPFTMSSSKKPFFVRLLLLIEMKNLNYSFRLACYRIDRWTFERHYNWKNCWHAKNLNILLKKRWPNRRYEHGSRDV